MATKKPASLASTLYARKGEAAPAAIVPPTPAEELAMKLTVKLTKGEYQRLLNIGMRTQPRRHNQDMIRTAVLRFLEEEEAR